MQELLGSSVYISRRLNNFRDMKVRFYHWYNAVLTALLSMLGYGCSNWTEPEVEYGMPTAKYVVNGTVTDEQNAPVEGIKVSLKSVSDARNADGKRYTHGIDSLQTDAAGRYEMKYSAFPERSDIKLIVEDIDGEANGTFQSDTIDVDYNKAVQTEKGSGWNEGTFEIKQDIKLK